MLASVSVVLKNIAYTGEGPHWNEESQSLYFVDILGKKVLKWDYNSGAVEEYQFGI